MPTCASEIVRHVVLILVVGVEGAGLLELLVEDARPPDALLLLLVELRGTLLPEGGVRERSLDV